MKRIIDDDIWLVEKNIRGAWVIYGVIGIKQYYYYTKKDAICKYKQEIKESLFRQTSANSARTSRA